MKKQQKLLRKHYHKKKQAALQQLKEFEQGNRQFTKLNSLAKKHLCKRIKAGYELPAKLFSKRV